MTSRFSIVALFAAAAALLAGPAWARCSQNLVQLGSGVQLASLDGFKVAADTSPNRVVVTFVGHSSFQIDTPQGVRAITDYGHLHHRLTKEHLEELGRIDVLMVPIDGSYTMGLPLMVDVIRQIQPRVVLPMHYWGRGQLDRFEGLMAPLDADFVWPDRRSVELVKEQLPERLTVIAVGGEGGG